MESKIIIKNLMITMYAPVHCNCTGFTDREQAERLINYGFKDGQVYDAIIHKEYARLCLAKSPLTGEYISMTSLFFDIALQIF
jgi:hypothetical protein